MEIGDLCVKVAGREAGKIVVILDKPVKNQVLVDGQVKRRKCNLLHLEPLNKKIKITKSSTAADIKKEFKALGLEIKETKSKKPAARPKKQRKVKQKEEKPKKKAVKKVKK